MTKPNVKILRCAVYTRKSSEDGLEQDFNSLDAQRESCEAYIKSQAGEGWKPIAKRYDDGGYSGGTLDRPGLEQLLADVRARRIDTIVVYKVDRLTRSLSDFARIVEVFDTHGVSFVSVTQQFNTTTSMGRLTLNMLLSFAQFEREVTGERIRDKIAASKQKGMWMGGYVPLGYEPNGRTLSINDAEAETVRAVFRLYLEHRNVRRVKAEADRLGLKTKMRETADGRMRGGRPLSRGYIYKLLGNPLYVGRIAHKEKTYEGQHPAIVDEETWEQVQHCIAGNVRGHRSQDRLSEPSPLVGKLIDETGKPLTPTHAVKSGKRYRYYVSRQLIEGTASELQSGNRDSWRLPAHDIERTIADSVAALLSEPSSLSQAARDAGHDAEDLPELIDAAAIWKGDALDLVDRADLESDRVTITLNFNSLVDGNAPPVRHAIPARIKRRGVETRLVIERPDDKVTAATPDNALIKAVVRAHEWFNDLATGRAASLTEIAEAQGVTPRYVGHILPLAFLSPDIVDAIMIGRQPVELTAETLIKRVDLPLEWSEQRSLLGVD